MTDNKKNTGKPDSYLISFKEKYEVEYAVNQLAKQTGATKKDSREALLKAAAQVDPSDGREKIMKQARKDLKK